MTDRTVLAAPQSWKTPDAFLSSLLQDPWYQSVYKLLGRTCISTYKFFESEGGHPALMPITTGSVSSPMGLGSDSLPVSVEMNGERTYLADSMQFYLELAVRIESSPAYYLMPSFRDEMADARHLNQFFHAEAEILGGLEDIQALAERYMLHLAKDLLETCADEIQSLAGKLSHVENFLARGQGFPQLSFADAMIKLEGMENAFERCETGDLTITNSGEAALLAEYGDFVWLTHFPMSTVPFYQARDPQNQSNSLSADLLAGIGEILGSGARAQTRQDVLHNIEAARVDANNYDWYLQMKEADAVQTAGFGLGIERFLMWITQTREIRDWNLLPRDRCGKGPI